MDEKKNSKTIRAGARTYFLDIKETQGGKPFVSITESRYKGENSQHQRASIVIFPEFFTEFHKAINTIANELEKPE